MDIISELKKRVGGNQTRVVYPEGAEPAVLMTARRLADEHIAAPILLGAKHLIEEAAVTAGVDLRGLTVIDPAMSSAVDEYAENFAPYCSLSSQILRKMLRKTVAYGCMMVRAGDSDMVIAGIAHPTEEVIMNAQFFIGMQEGVTAPSSFMLMDIPNYEGEEGSLLVYADASVNPDPTPEELAGIAVITAQNVRNMLGWEPRVAMLSFSTCGSASHPHVDKVTEALRIARNKNMHLLIDGEFQLDTAIVRDVAQRKMKRESAVAGRANILIFPDLDAANIAYKITQRLAGAAAYGMVLQGFSRPVCDLSRGATAEDIFGLSLLLVAGFTAQKEQGIN
jgi:phosphate acetyltransferase